MGKFNFTRSALVPIISPLSLLLAQLRIASLMGVDAGCDRKCMHFGVFEDDEATINEHCNTTCDSSGSKEPRWVMFPAILQLLP